MEVFQNMAKVWWAPFNRWFSGGWGPMVTIESQRLQSCKDKVRFLCSSHKLISQLTGAQVTTMCQAVDCRISSQARSHEIQTLKKTFASQQFMYNNCDPWFKHVNTKNQTFFHYTTKDSIGKTRTNRRTKCSLVAWDGQSDNFISHARTGQETHY